MPWESVDNRDDIDARDIAKVQEWLGHECDRSARAIKLLKRHADERYPFCDGLSFVLMEQLGVSEALSFDGDFRSYGKIALLSCFWLGHANIATTRL